MRNWISFLQEKQYRVMMDLDFEINDADIPLWGGNVCISTIDPEDYDWGEQQENQELCSIRSEEEYDDEEICFPLLKLESCIVLPSYENERYMGLPNQFDVADSIAAETAELYESFIQFGKEDLLYDGYPFTVHFKKSLMESSWNYLTEEDYPDDYSILLVRDFACAGTGPLKEFIEIHDEMIPSLFPEINRRRFVTAMSVNKKEHPDFVKALLEGGWNIITLHQSMIDSMIANISRGGEFSMDSYKSEPQEDWVCACRIVKK